MAGVQYALEVHLPAEDERASNDNDQQHDLEPSSHDLVARISRITSSP
jgi:hypothetical protein